jgi:hypothetical protein
VTAVHHITATKKQALPILGMNLKWELSSHFKFIPPLSNTQKSTMSKASTEIPLQDRMGSVTKWGQNPELPQLWILAPVASEPLLTRFAIQPSKQFAVKGIVRTSWIFQSRFW